MIRELKICPPALLTDEIKKDIRTILKMEMFEGFLYFKIHGNAVTYFQNGKKLKTILLESDVEEDRVIVAREKGVLLYGVFGEKLVEIV